MKTSLSAVVGAHATWPGSGIAYIDGAVAVHGELRDMHGVARARLDAVRVVRGIG